MWSKVKNGAAQSAIAASSLIGSGANTPSVSPPAPLDEFPAFQRVKEFGENGEVIVSSGNSIQIWDWTTGDQTSLSLAACLDDIPLNLSMICPLKCDRSARSYVILICYATEDDPFVLEVRSNKPSENITLRRQRGTGPFTVKRSTGFYVVSSLEGNLTVYDMATHKPLNVKLDCKVFQKRAIFDVQNHWMVYNASFEESLSAVLNAKEGQLTPVNFSKADNFLNKVLKNLSSTAIDGVIRVSRVSQSKIRNYLNPQEAAKGDSHTFTSMKDVKNTINKIISHLNGSSSKDVLILVPLDELASGNWNPIFMFSPGGCSHVSMSPYDMLLSTVTLRGDNIFVWDYTKMTSSVNLVETFKRGSTPGIIEQTLWGKGNGFLCTVSGGSGSVRCFMNDPNDKTGFTLEESQSWVFSSLLCKKIALGPDATILVFDDSDDLRIIEPGGKISSKFQLPYETSREFVERRLSPIPTVLQTQDPLSEAIIETCSPYPVIFANKRVGFSTFKEEESATSDLDLVIKCLSSAVKDVPCHAVNFGKADGAAIFNKADEAMSQEGGLEDLRNAMQSFMMLEGPEL